MSNPSYPSNCWYVVATSDEIDATPRAYRLLDRALVVYRVSGGSVSALEDRCAHRGYPLSEGRLDGDKLVCGYHGFEYGPSGLCTRVPSQPNVPPGVCVRSFPVHEEPPFVWLWRGQAGTSSRRPPPRLPYFDKERWAVSCESHQVSANYMLLHEHLLDVTHHFIVHPETTPPGIDELPPLNRVEVSETSVAYTRDLPAAPLAEWEAETTGLDRDREYGRRERGSFVSPSLHVGRWEIDGGEGSTHVIARIHTIAPMSEHETKVHLLVARNYQMDRLPVTQHLQTFFHQIAERDYALLERIQSYSGPEAWIRGTRVNADSAALRARRIVEVMLAEEAGRSPTRPGYGPSEYR